MRRNLFFRLLARLRVGRKLLLIYLLDLSAVVYISGILIHEKYLSIDFSDKEIVGNAYVRVVREALADVALAGAEQKPAAQTLADAQNTLADAEKQYGAQMQSAALNARVRTALAVLARQTGSLTAAADDALDACRELITRVGNQSNLILDPDLDSYYSMSLSILRYPALLSSVNDIGRLLREGRRTAHSHDELRTRYLVLEGQLDGVMQGLRSDFSEAGAANPQVNDALAQSIGQLTASVSAFRDTAHRVVDTTGDIDASMIAVTDDTQQKLVVHVRDAWRATDAELEQLLRARVRGLFARMWLHLGTALFLLCSILCMVYFVAQQISRPLRQLARVMDTVRRTGDHSLRAKWDSQDEIGKLVTGFNEMLEQLDRERDLQKEMAATARASAAQHALVEATPVPMMVTAVPGHEVLHANQPALAWLNGCTVDPWAFGLDSSVRARFFQQLSDREAVDEFEVRWKAGVEPTWAMLSARRLNFQGREAVLTAFTPINQIKLMEQRLELWARVFEASSEAILILDHERRLLSANASFYRATGYSPEDIVGRAPNFVVAGPHGDTTIAGLAARVDRSSAWSGEAHIRRRHGGDYPAWLMLSAVRDERTNISHYICTVIDITDRKKSEARIRFLAEHDVLTELPNRARFTKRVGAVMEHARETGQRFAVLFIDLDCFKDINDSLGHHVGDGLLQSISRRLLQAVRSGDTVSRLGGDEFTVLLADVSSAADVARIIDQRLLPLVRQSHQIGGVTLQVLCSVGVALYPDDGDDIETLMQNADTAMYQAKAAGRNLVKFFSPEMAERTRRRLALEVGLRMAIERGELRLAFQPCLDAETGALASAEALLRWTNAQLGVVAPVEFIPIAEDTRLIVPIGAWVIDEACRQIARWRAQSLPDMRVSINLSAIQLVDPSLIDTLRDAMTKHRVMPAQLELEITETVLMDSAAARLETINAIRALGVKLSLDDFGTGYSSLSYLNRFPLDRLKIDRAFVHDMLDAPADLAVIRTIVELGHKLGLRVVAEGVESEQEAETLRGIGCDELQGFLYAHALSGDELLAWTHERRQLTDA
ncbi:EAL domain-containing protein [Paraburkholderia caballeronis]|uniref:PAS domain S-box-containing protein/diguanylate cyclase (GGDEF) domain-containing protein n=1 Tax=Paraburkholderia caballeronis TaxID=416943 RepID=A0A1H7FXN1_9BURK|nr:EAL domain-containing protein [Paraburkholderia caballeronis]PXW24855.1 PAS domain S-box-containing protein/diguanylate cyclase (GGDEF)-like protein [Paraburkholderia caballeronis]PXX00585.1 PAS domain S-box-containing protein/diguanylate cyclase (GGDEF)-like protein [Paraburkholderia caballeronis]RAJ98648.1 PAS domain S-box-containing protein/diguanylate cyclase (GGDEF)-like protein [Paraburkholderia caballeronis]SEE69076.1 PAS domain S-box-containing protein/diguanylate cyclase (GGDEF) dom